MTTFIAPVPARTAVGDTIMVNGCPVAVAHLLPGRRRTARVTADPPCDACNRTLCWDVATLAWQCPDCRQTYPDREALADLLAEHVAGNDRRDQVRRARQVRSGAPGAATILHRAAVDGGALSRTALFENATGPERRALRWALRNDGDWPLSAERCRVAAAELARLTPGDLMTGGRRATGTAVRGATGARGRM